MLKVVTADTLTTFKNRFMLSRREGLERAVDLRGAAFFLVAMLLTSNYRAGQFYPVLNLIIGDAIIQ